MGAFELNSSTHRSDTRNDTRNETRNDTRADAARTEVQDAEGLSSRRPRPECIIALKVYDGCSLKECLDDLGPAHFIEGCECTNQVVYAPENADDVTVDCVRIKGINIRKQPSRFKACQGYWDIFLEFVFEYRLTFFCNDEVIDEAVWACNTYRKRLTLFGSTGNDLAFAIDLFRASDCNVIGTGPYVSVEAKAIALCAKIVEGCTRPRHEHEGQREVTVIMGLYAIIRLSRIVNLSVESRGFCDIPEECDCSEIDCLNPCDFFNKLDFPANLFTPSAKSEC